MKDTREIGRVAAISVKCKTCGKVFAMDRREILWYSNMGYPLPKRCPECRKKRKEMKELEKKELLEMVSAGLEVIFAKGVIQC